MEIVRFIQNAIIKALFNILIVITFVRGEFSCGFCVKMFK